MGYGGIGGMVSAAGVVDGAIHGASQLGSGGGWGGERIFAARKAPKAVISLTLFSGGKLVGCSVLLV